MEYYSEKRKEFGTVINVSKLDGSYLVRYPNGDEKVEYKTKRINSRMRERIVIREQWLKALGH